MPLLSLHDPEVVEAYKRRARVALEAAGARDRLDTGARLTPQIDRRAFSDHRIRTFVAASLVGEAAVGPAAVMHRISYPASMADGLIAYGIAAAGAFIALGQFRLARKRLRFDLYDRRYKIFEGARKLIVEIMREGFAERQSVFAYHRETGDAIFLLNREITSYLGALEKQAFPPYPYPHAPRE